MSPPERGESYCDSGVALVYAGTTPDTAPTVIATVGQIVADIPTLGQLIPRHAPICTVLASGATPAAVERQLQGTVRECNREPEVRRR